MTQLEQTVGVACGTEYGYVCGCRCNLCRAAYAERQRPDVDDHDGRQRDAGAEARREDLARLDAIPLEAAMERVDVAAAALCGWLR